MKTGTELGVVEPKMEGHWGHQRLEEARTESLQFPRRESCPADTLTLTLASQLSERVFSVTLCMTLCMATVEDPECDFLHVGDVTWGDRLTHTSTYTCGVQVSTIIPGLGVHTWGASSLALRKGAYPEHCPHQLKHLDKMLPQAEPARARTQGTLSSTHRTGLGGYGGPEDTREPLCMTPQKEAGKHPMPPPQPCTRSYARVRMGTWYFC